MQLYGFQPDLLVLDYVGEIKDDRTVATWESRQRFVRDLRGFASEEHVCVLTALQVDKKAKETVRSGQLIDDDNLADAKGQTRPLDALWTLNQRKIEYEAKVARGFVSKHRFGESRFEFCMEMDRERTLELREISKAEYERRVNEIASNKEVTSRESKQLEQLAIEAREAYKAKKEAEKAAKFKNDPGKAME